MKKNIRYSIPVFCLIVTSLTLTAHAQTLTSIVPNNAEQGESLSVTITGSDTTFMQGSSTVTAVWFAQGSSTINASSFWANSDTSASANFNIPGGASTGSWDVKVTDTIDGTLTLSSGFTINTFNPPELIAISPNTAQPGQTLTVLISGQDTNFSYQQGSGTTVWFSQGSSTGAWSVNDSQLIAELSVPTDAIPGTYDLSVNNGVDGTMTLVDGFTVNSVVPTIHSVTPNAAYQGESLTVTLTTQNIDYIQGSGTLSWFSQDSSIIVSQSSIMIDNYGWSSSSAFGTQSSVFDIPQDALPGLYDLNVFSIVDGHIILADGFRVMQPGDWTGDGLVNLVDLVVVADNWLAGVPLSFYSLSFDSDPGWTTDGQWAFGQPTGSGGTSYGNPDPISGIGGSNVYGVNLNGDYDLVTGGPYYLTSAPIDCSDYHDVQLKFARWLNSDYPPYVDNKVEVSIDGTNWFSVWNGALSVPVTDSSWQHLEYDISGVADGEGTVFVRFGYEIIDGTRALPYSGWNIGDVQLLGIR